MSASDDYQVPGNLQGGPRKVGGDFPERDERAEMVAIPDGCAALWHERPGTVVMLAAETAARRTHRDQAVLLSDGTVKVIPGGVPGLATTGGGDA